MRYIAAHPLSCTAPLLATLLAGVSSVAVARDADVQFKRDVAPILLRRCAGCHGEKKSEGGYRLHTFAGLMSAGDSEIPPVVPGSPDESELLGRILETDASLRMPQEDDPLDRGQIEQIRRWIQAGAVFDGSDERTSYKPQLPPPIHPPPPATYRRPVPIQALDFSPDGRQLVASGYHELTIWNVATGELARRIIRLPQRIQAVRWYSVDALLVAGGSPGDYGELAIVDLAAGDYRVLGTFEDIVLDAAIDSQHLRIAAGTAAGKTRVYDILSGDLLWKAGVHAGAISGIAFSADDQYVVSASRDQTAKVHQADTGSLFTTFNGHRMQFGSHVGRFAVYDVAFDPDSGRAVTAGEGLAIRVWDPAVAREENGTAADMEKRFAKAGHTRFISHSFSQPVFRLAVRDGQVLVAGEEGSVVQVDLESGQRVRAYAGHSDWVYAVAFAPRAGRAASGSFDGELRIWDTQSGDCLHAFIAAPGLHAAPAPPSR